MTTTTTETTTTKSMNDENSGSTQERLESLVVSTVEPLGYEMVHVEFQTHRNKIIRVFIDRANSSEGIGIEDCAKVSRALDEPLEKLSEIDSALSGGYELEVSSPGVDRPLRNARDYEKFSGREARLHVFRPLTAEELANADYQKRNPKQKNFIGLIQGMDGESVKLSIAASMGSVAKTAVKGQKKSNKPAAKVEEKRDLVKIPLELISKANLEPDFEVLEEK